MDRWCLNMVNGIRLRIRSRRKVEIKKYDDNMNLCILK
jgi:hypothetical protein